MHRLLFILCWKCSAVTFSKTLRIIYIININISYIEGGGEAGNLHPELWKIPPRLLENSTQGSGKLQNLQKPCGYTFLDKQVSEENFLNDNAMSSYIEPSLCMCKKKYNLFIEIIRSLLKISLTGATPKIAKRTMHI